MNAVGGVLPSFYIFKGREGKMTISNFAKHVHDDNFQKKMDDMFLL
jgi:hypothetical protein